MPPDPVLSPIERAFLAEARRATLATIDPSGRPRLIPICFVLDPREPILYSPLDDKPKRTNDVLTLARVKDIATRPDVSVLADRWDEDWTRLAWLRCRGRAWLVPPTPGMDHVEAVTAMREKYPQYLAHDIGSRPLIAVTIEDVVSWGALGDESGG